MSLRIQAIASGSNGNCFVVDSPEGSLLIDAGISRKQILNGLQRNNISVDHIRGILVTHAHSDHIKGLPVLSQDLSAPVYATEGTINEMSKLDHHDDRWVNIVQDSHLITPGKISNIGPFKIITMATSHDINGAVAFRVNYPSLNQNKNGVTISIVTDTGDLGEKQIWQLSRSDLILLESNHDLNALKYSARSEYLKRRIRNNHLSNKQTSEILENSLKARSIERIKAVMIGHLSGECNSPELIRESIKNWQQKNDSNINFYFCPRDLSSDFLEISIDEVKTIRKYAGPIDW